MANTTADRKNWYIYMTNCDINKSLRMLEEMREKEKKIKKMSSLQRKLHQRQFAVVHFLIHGMKKFASEFFCDDINVPIRISIICEDKTKHAAEYMYQQLALLVCSREKIDINLYTKDKINEAFTSCVGPKNEYRIFIGDFSVSKSIANDIRHWEFEQFGFRYGWKERNAVISFSCKPSREEFEQMERIASSEFINAKYEIDMISKIEGSLWNELSTTQKIAVGTVAALAIFAMGGAAVAAVGHKKKSEDKQSYHIPRRNIKNLSTTQIEDLMKKKDINDITDEEWEYLMERSPEYAEEWIERSVDLENMTIEEYDELRDFADYSGMDFDDVVEWKW